MPSPVSMLRIVHLLVLCKVTASLELFATLVTSEISSLWGLVHSLGVLSDVGPSSDVVVGVVVGLGIIVRVIGGIGVPGSGCVATVGACVRLSQHPVHIHMVVQVTPGSELLTTTVTAISHQALNVLSQPG